MGPKMRGQKLPRIFGSNCPTFLGPVGPFLGGPAEPHIRPKRKPISASKMMLSGPTVLKAEPHIIFMLYAMEEGRGIIPRGGSDRASLPSRIQGGSFQHPALIGGSDRRLIPR